MTIRHKLTLLVMSNCIFSLFLVGAGFVFLSHMSVRQMMDRNLSILAEITADNSSAAVAFENVEDANKVLSTLAAESSIIGGCIRLPDGSEFAEYYRGDVDSVVCPYEAIKKMGIDNVKFPSAMKYVELDGERIGMACLLADVGPLRAMLVRNIGIVVVALFFVALVVYYLSSGLQQIISGPILSLAEAAISVSNTRYRSELASSLRS